MSFQVRTEELGQVDGLERTVYVLEGAGDRAEIWPARGFNCYRWSVRHGGLDVLYADAQFLEGSSPTRTGIPVLFPFPNRIRGGRFQWDSKEYALPQNDPAKKNAIHGFACRRPWRVVGHGADAVSAWVTGEFHGSNVAADAQELWPADYRLRLTYWLSAGRLRVEAVVDNPDRRRLPFGLGYHPYFRVENDCLIQVPARKYWQLEENLPTGARPDIDAERDLNQPRSFAELKLDDILTDLTGPVSANGLRLAGTIERARKPGADQPAGPFQLEVLTSEQFREVVVFTPPHRQAFCIEPYTCTTDAINLQPKGVAAGWMVLEPGQTWSGVVELAIQGLL